MRVASERDRRSRKNSKPRESERSDDPRKMRVTTRERSNTDTGQSNTDTGHPGPLDMLANLEAIEVAKKIGGSVTPLDIATWRCPNQPCTSRPPTAATGGARCTRAPPSLVGDDPLLTPVLRGTRVTRRASSWGRVQVLAGERLQAGASGRAHLSASDGRHGRRLTHPSTFVARTRRRAPRAGPARRERRTASFEPGQGSGRSGSASEWAAGRCSPSGPRWSLGRATTVPNQVPRS